MAVFLCLKQPVDAAASPHAPGTAGRQARLSGSIVRLIRGLVADVRDAGAFGQHCQTGGAERRRRNRHSPEGRSAMPVTEAMQVSQSWLLAPPPVASSLSGVAPASVRTSVASAMANATPCKTARAISPGHGGAPGQRSRPAPRRHCAACARPTDRGGTADRWQPGPLPPSAPSALPTARPVMSQSHDTPIAGRQDDTHLVPAVRQGVAKGVGAAFGAGAKLSVTVKTTPDVPSERKLSPGATTPSPTAAAALSPPPPATTGLPSTPHWRAISARSWPDTALPSTRRGIDPRSRPQMSRSLRPVAPCNIEPQRPRGVRHVGHFPPVMLKPQIILEQQNGGKLSEQLRLGLGHPNGLRGGKSGHHRIAANPAKGRMVPVRDASPAVPSGCRSTEMAGRSTASRASRAVRPCIWPDSPMPATAAIFAWMTGGKLARRRDRPPATQSLRVLFRPPLTRTADGKRNRTCWR